MKTTRVVVTLAYDGQQHQLATDAVATHPTPHTAHVTDLGCLGQQFRRIIPCPASNKNDTLLICSLLHHYLIIYYFIVSYKHLT